MTEANALVWLLLASALVGHYHQFSGENIIERPLPCNFIWRQFLSLQ